MVAAGLDERTCRPRSVIEPALLLSYCPTDTNHDVAELYQNSVRLASHRPVPAIAPDSLPGEHF
jgi:hypothetical protein